MKNKKKILGFTLTLALLVGVFGISNVSNAATYDSSAISDFESCAKVYGVQESAPVRCTDLKTGKVYIQGRGVIKGDVKSDIKPVAPNVMNFGLAANLSQETIEKYKAYCVNIGGSLTKNSAGFLICDNFTKNEPTIKNTKPDAETIKLKKEMEAKLKAAREENELDSDDDSDAEKKEVRAEVSVDVKADINRDGKVGFADLRKLMSLWGKCQDKLCFGDLNNDMEVNHADIEVLFKFWTEPNEKGMAQKCLTLKDGEMERSCFWSMTVGNEKESKEKREKMKAGFEKMKPELKGNEEVEKKIDNFLFHMDNTLTKISGVIARLKTTTDKIETRIKIMEEEGKDLTEIKGMIKEVRAKLDTAQTESKDISVDSEKVAENKTEFFAKIRTIANNVKEAQKILEKIVLSLKAI
ncbi:MAG: hypothetical protein AAB534_03215 [Patescibacteria group bacterium]